MRQPGIERGEGAEIRLRGVGPDRDGLTLALLVGLGAAHQHAQAAAGDGFDVAECQRHQFGTAQRGTEAHQQHGAVPGAERGVGGGALGHHQPQHAGHGGGGLATRADALGPGDAFDHHGEARVAQVERRGRRADARCGSRRDARGSS